MSGEFRDKFAIVGAAHTPTARTHSPGLSAHQLEAWAVKLALEDAGLAREDLDGAVHAMAFPGSDAYSRKLGLRSNFYVPIGRAAGSITGLMLATQALATGNATHVAVSNGFTFWSDSHRELSRPVTRHGADKVMINRDGGGLVDLGWAATPGAAAVHAWYAARHMHQYGTTYEQLGSVALAHRAWANLNPAARFYDRPLTMDDYLASRWVVEPFRLLDNSLMSDTGCAFIVTTAERAQHLRQKPVYVKGIGLGDAARNAWWEKTNFTETDAAHAVHVAFKEAGIGIDDVDVAEFYDCFTSEIILMVEDYGWCEKGEGGPFVQSGATSPGGAHPINTYGGLLSGFHCGDIGNVIEAVHQLQGVCGERQVEGAEIALANGHGGEMVLPYMCPIHGTAVLGNVES
jgi:acetyl-CoA acetyltransferase